MIFQLTYYKQNDSLEEGIAICQQDKHIQQVAYSTFHGCLTQICFTCKQIRTTIRRSEIEGIMPYDFKHAPLSTKKGCGRPIKELSLSPPCGSTDDNWNLLLCNECEEKTSK